MGSVEVNEVIKVGRKQKTQVLWRAVFLMVSPLALGGSAAKKLLACQKYRQLRRLGICSLMCLLLNHLCLSFFTVN